MRYKMQIQECRRRMVKIRSRRDSYGVSQYKAVRSEFLKLLERQEIY